MKTTKRILYLLLILLAVITFFMRDNYRHVKNISPEVLRDPIQNTLTDARPISFSKDKFDYTVTPVASYEISGLLVSRNNYDNWYSLSKTDAVYPVDLCLLWGENVSNKSYRSSGVKFRQDSRFCFWSWSDPNITVAPTAISNNHLLIKDHRFDQALSKLRRGDQIKLKGKLVNVTAKDTKSKNPYDFAGINWQTSTVRDDTGGGACEIILVEDIQILHSANPLARLLFPLSLAGLGLLLLFGISRLVWSLFHPQEV